LFVAGSVTHPLLRSSQNWHSGEHDLIPWLGYFLGVIRRAYGIFAERAGQVRAPLGAKTSLIRDAIGQFLGRFSIAEVEHACPGVSRDLIRRVLRQMQKDDAIECLSRGRSAVWQKKG
jgi:hypothetical protein